MRQRTKGPGVVEQSSCLEAAQRLSSALTARNLSPMNELLETLRAVRTASQVKAEPVAPAPLVREPGFSAPVGGAAEAAVSPATVQAAEPRATELDPPRQESSRDGQGRVEQTHAMGRPATGTQDLADGERDPVRKRQAVEREAFAALGRLAEALRREDPLAPAPYRLVRAVVWSTIRLPDSDTQGRTRLPAPPGHVLARIAAPVSAQRPLETLLDTEELVSGYPLWIDLQRRSAECLEQLGGAEAAGVIREESARLLDRCPNLSRLRFANGHPLVSEETLTWSTAGRVGSGPAASAALHGSERSRQSLPAVSNAENQRLESTALEPPHELGPGLAWLVEKSRCAESARKRFELRVRMVSLCLEHGRADLGRPISELLTVDLDRFGLQEWEPELAATACRLHLLTLRADPKTTSREERLRLWDSYCKLDPAAALLLGPER